MIKLGDVLAIEEDEVKQATLKKVFMPYSENIDIDGREREALTVLINLSSHHKGSKCTDWLDIDRAKSYLSQEANVDLSLAEIKWFHTHNLKYPDCRVSAQRIIAEPLPAEDAFISSSGLPPSLGWAHNSASYRHTIWLLSSFCWQSRTFSIVSLIQQQNPVWLDLLQEFGLSVKSLNLISEEIELQLLSTAFPTEVNTYSKQLRFPWNGDYLSVTPVVSHAMQSELEHRQRSEDSHLKFVTMLLPNSASIGNLCGSVGGYMKVLNYPLDISPKVNRASSEQTLGASRQRNGRCFDDYQITNIRICEILNRLVGAEPLKTHKQRVKARKDQSKILRKQIALWMLPLIELRDRMVNDERERTMHGDQLIHDFLFLPERELSSLATSLNQKLHLVLQGNKFTRKFAYHPRLMQLIKAQIVWILDVLSKPQQQEGGCGAEEQYIYLSSLRVQDALAVSSPYLCGVPSLTAIWGFVHQYQRDFNTLTNGDAFYDFTGFAFYVRSQNIIATAKLTEPCSLAKARTLSNAKRSTIRGDRLTDLEIDLVIRVQSRGRLSDCSSELKNALPVSFAGGSVFQPRISSKIDWLRTFCSRSSLLHILKGLPAYGSWLYPSERQPESFDELELMLLENENYLPVSNGYHLLEVPTQRKNSLTDLHAYVENTLSVANQVNPIEMRFSGRAPFFEQAFWSLECRPTTILIKKL
ncbi:type I-F CRISPR-associated protein Csy2 [Vibrio parahaemolyticus]|uniref:type I-F CRISPR-associated protein Csy2 n=1 Tax=Vibrio parahaemolyticus TaxID=670 RepID=UPI0003ED8DC5|nr:type I-F CRISPR-associated protein Csy2 [Vibrio parahaemolyticus]AHI99022.1 hypothetical protein VPUCM_1064 [Vibrio parahaemolyticus UCM-V493]EJG0777793.1 hypothetical protein [Vibrio parahaemolyticus]